MFTWEVEGVCRLLIRALRCPELGGVAVLGGLVAVGVVAGHRVDELVGVGVVEASLAHLSHHQTQQTAGQGIETIHRLRKRIPMIQVETFMTTRY